MGKSQKPTPIRYEMDVVPFLKHPVVGSFTGGEEGFGFAKMRLDWEPFCNVQPGFLTGI
jgi:hypothetical protein